MSEQIWNVMTPFGDVAELGQGYMGRADGERLWVPLPEPATVESEVAFVIYLLDGTPAFAGSGRCIQIADQGDAVDPQVRFEALLDSLVFDERSQPVYDYIVAVRNATMQGGEDYEVPSEDEAPLEDAYAAEEDVVALEASEYPPAEDVIAVSNDEEAYGQPLADPTEVSEVPEEQPDATLEAEDAWPSEEHGDATFASHAVADDTAVLQSDAAPSWSMAGEESDAYGEEVSDMPVHAPSDAPELSAPGEGTTDPGFAEPTLMSDPYNAEATQPGGGGMAYPSTAGLQHAHTAEAFGSEYDEEGYGEEDAMELPPEIATRVTPSARPAEAAVETVMTPSIMPIATGILSRPAIALHFQPVRARGPGRSAATGLFEYPVGTLPKPERLPQPNGY